MQVRGETLLFKNDFGFSTSISNKNPDGTYENMAISVQFRKGDMDAQRIPNKTKINIKNGFLTFYKSTNGMPKIKVVVLDYEVLGDINKNSDSYDDPFVASQEVTVNYDDDDLPF